MPILTKLREFLEQEKVAYSVHSHPEAYTALEIAALEHVKGRMLAKVVIVRTEAGELVMIVLPADRRVDFRKVAAVLETEKLRLGQESEFRDRFPACEVGAMPPFGNLSGCRCSSTNYSPRTMRSYSTLVLTRSRRSCDLQTSGGWWDPASRASRSRSVDTA